MQKFDTGTKKRVASFALYMSSIAIAIGIGAWQVGASNTDGLGSGSRCNVYTTTMVNCGTVTMCGNARYSVWNITSRPFYLACIRGSADVCVFMHNNSDICAPNYGSTTCSDDCSME